MKNEKCQELENIKYKSMLLNPNSHKDYTTTANINNINNIEDILDKESQLSKLLPWNKLEKCQKISKINDFVEIYCSTNNINKQDEIELKKYLKERIERKKLRTIKEVDYDKTTGIIKNIPGLTYNEKNSEKSNKFTLKNEEKLKSASLKGLAPKNKTKKIKKPSKIIVKNSKGSRSSNESPTNKN